MSTENAVRVSDDTDLLIAKTIIEIKESTKNKPSKKDLVEEAVYFYSKMKPWLKKEVTLTS